MLYHFQIPHPDILGVETIDHYKASFDNEGFMDVQLKPRMDVGCRDPNPNFYAKKLDFRPVSQGIFRKLRIHPHSCPARRLAIVLYLDYDRYVSPFMESPSNKTREQKPPCFCVIYKQPPL